MSMHGSTYDAVVVGGGPGGATAAAVLSSSGLRTLLVEKYAFPRDKICGDAISGKSMDVMRRLGIAERVDALPQTGIRGVTFSSPSGSAVSIPFPREGDDRPGFVCRRTEFDRLIFETAVDAGAEAWENTEMRDLLCEDDVVRGVRVRRGGQDVDVEAPVVIGADGAYSTVARALGLSQLRPRHYVAGLRSYYDELGGQRRPGFIELHFVDEVLPGYFWIFELPNGAANVGVGMLSASVKKRGIRLKKAFEEVVRSPRFAARFEGARRRRSVVGWGLPLGSKPRSMAGDGWMLVGDAASLIDPFTGEGIGNAMLSGLRAAEWAARAHESGRFSRSFLKGYEEDVLEALRGELHLSHMLQRMLRWRPLVNAVIRKAARSDELAATISSMFDDLDVRKRLLSPLFYLRVLKS